MPEGKADGRVIIGSSEEGVQRSLMELITGNFAKNVFGVTETSDLLLEILTPRKGDICC